MSIHTETREQKLQRLTHDIHRGFYAPPSEAVAARMVANLQRERKLRARRRFWRDLRNQAGESLNAFSEKIDALFYFGFCYLMAFAVLYFGWHIWGLIGRLQGWWL